MKLHNLYPFARGYNFIYEETESFCVGVVILKKGEHYEVDFVGNIMFAVLHGTVCVNGDKTRYTVNEIYDDGCVHDQDTVLTLRAISNCEVLLVTTKPSFCPSIQMHDIDAGTWHLQSDTSDQKTILFFRFYPTNGYALIRAAESAAMVCHNDAVVISAKMGYSFVSAPAYYCKVFCVGGCFAPTL